MDPMENDASGQRFELIARYYVCFMTVARSDKFRPMDPARWASFESYMEL